MKSSKFLWLTHPGTNVRPLHDIVVLENEYFVAMPSLGALVDVWLVVIPRRPMATLSSMTDQERTALNDLRGQLNAKARARSQGEVLYEFEHGGVYGGVVSCGVDQAHLHMTWLPFDLMEVCKSTEMDWRQSGDISLLTSETAGLTDYLFVQGDGHALIANPQQPTSQWFRKLIGTVLGSIEWDYKLAPNHPRIKQMANQFGVAV
jgi:hypothetical protein